MRKILSIILVLAIALMAVMPVLALSASAETTEEKGKLKITGSKYVAKGCSITLTASEKVKWKSSDPKIATVNSKGKVKGIKAGKVKITATSKADKNRKATFTVTVKKKAAKKIVIDTDTTTLDLADEDSTALDAEISPSSAAQKVTWTSSNKKVAKVNSEGIVVAVSVGKAKITAKAVDGSKVEKSITIKVIDSAHPEPEEPEDPEDPPAPSPEGSPRYFALIVGNGTGYASSQLYGPANDARAMKGMLGTMTSQNWNITLKENQTAAGIRCAISSAFSGATANDVCLFFYSGHGYSGESSDEYQGALAGVDEQPVTGYQLANALNNATPGKVIVLLDSCGSGGLIYGNGETQPDLKEEARKFVNSMIDAFDYYNNLNRKQAGISANTGELLGNKFQVLAACEYRENAIDAGSYSIFTKALVLSAGCSFPDGSRTGRMPADSNSDDKLTLQEAYNGICNNVAELLQYSVYWQNTQKSGDNNFVLFSR